MASDLLLKMMSNAGLSNRNNIEQARAELAGAITRIVINQSLTEARQRAKIRDETLNRGEKPE